MTSTYPANLRPHGGLTAADVDLLNDPSAFATELYRALPTMMEVLLTAADPGAARAFDAALELVKETAAAGGDVAAALDCVSDVAYNMAADAHSRGMEMGIAIEYFRQALIDVLRPTMAAECRHRFDLENVEQRRAKLRERPQTAA